MAAAVQRRNCRMSKALAKSKAKSRRKAGKKAHIKKGTKGEGYCVVAGKKRKSRKSKR